MLQRLILSNILALLAIVNACVADPPARFEFSRIMMGAEARLVMYAENEAEAVKAAQAAFARIAELDEVMSDYRQDSELMKLCRRAGDGPVAASDDLIDVLGAADRIARISGGAFDPTVGPVVRLWRQARRDQTMPPTDALARARSLVDFRDVIINHDARTIELRTPGMQLDLGGIGKGFAADAALATLRHEGISSCLIDMSGDITVGDPPPGRDAWTITVAHGDGSSIDLKLANASVATSGDTEQHVEIDGVRYSHIVDPRTGLGLTTRVATTVVAPTGTEADALASATCVLGMDQGIALIETLPGVACLASVPGPEGPVRAASTGFKSR